MANRRLPRLSGDIQDASAVVGPNLEERVQEKRKRLLGMPFGTAAARLRKVVMFDLVQRLGINHCYRCQQVIANADDLSIEHMEAWESAAEPAQAFFGLQNISFSHRSCNYRAAARPNQKYADGKERSRANFKNFYARHGRRWNDTRNKRRRKPAIIE